MNLVNMRKLTLLVASLVLCTISAQMVEFTEDPYAYQAPAEIVALAQKAAKLVGFAGNYEVIIPKKAGVEINPWNKFVSSGVNPFTKNFLIIVNQEWFTKIPEAEQLYLLARYFMSFKEGMVPTSINIVHYIFLVIGFLLTLLIFWLLGRTQLAHRKTWIRALAAFLVATAVNNLIMNNLQIRLTQYVAARFDERINEMAAEKAGGKQIAVKALELIDTSINEELNKGETFWIPYKDMFKNFAKQLE